jgi:hypothetical protein
MATPQTFKKSFCPTLSMSKNRYGIGSRFSPSSGNSMSTALSHPSRFLIRKSSSSALISPPLVYHATEMPTCGTRTLSGETNISTVWARRDGRWQMHLYSEYAIPPK